MKSINFDLNFMLIMFWTGSRYEEHISNMTLKDKHHKYLLRNNYLEVSV
jgi:hypothetical protein